MENPRKHGIPLVYASSPGNYVLALTQIPSAAFAVERLLLMDRGILNGTERCEPLVTLGRSLDYYEIFDKTTEFEPVRFKQDYDGQALHVARSNSGYRLVDGDGNQFSDDYFYISPPSNKGLFIIEFFEDKPGIVDRDGQWLVPPGFTEVQMGLKPNANLDLYFFDVNNFIHAQLEGRRNILLNDHGVPLGPDEGSLVASEAPDARGFYIAGKDGKYGFTDMKGDWIIEPAFDEVQPFSAAGVAPVRQGDRWGLIDASGKVVVPLMYERLTSCVDDGTCAVMEGGKWGFIDFTGATVIAPRFSGLGGFGPHGRAPAAEGDAWGIIDRHGDWVLRPSLAAILEFNSDGHARAVTFISEDATREGVIDETGQWVLEPEYWYVDLAKSGPSTGVAAVQKDGYGALINLDTGRELFRGDGCSFLFRQNGEILGDCPVHDGNHIDVLFDHTGKLLYTAADELRAEDN